MAIPQFRAVGTRLASASAATLSPVKPTLISGVSGILLCVVTSKNNAVHSCSTTGWSQLGSQLNSGASFTSSLWIALDSAAAPTFTWTGAAACSAQIALYYDIDGPLSTSAVTVKTTGTGTTNPHTSLSFNSTADNVVAVYVDVCASATGLGTPSTWTEDSDNTSATDAGDTTWGHKELGPSGTPSAPSGSISVNGGAAAWVQRQLQIASVYVSAGGLNSSSVEGGGWLDSPDGLISTMMEAGGWIDHLNGIDSSLVEAGAWLDPGVTPSLDGGFVSIIW